MWTEAQNKALDTDGRLLVSASAGSGKTTVMMERAARFLEQGGEISRMVILTFTNAAAAEMKEKLLKILYERIRAGVNRAHLMQAVKKVPLARICTIDSFCLNLYRTYFERLGLSPDLTPMDTDESEAMFMNAARETLTAATDGDVETLSFLERYTSGQKLDVLMNHMKSLWQFSAVKPDTEGFLLRAAEKADFVLESDLAEKRKRAARLIERAEDLLSTLALNWEKGFGKLQKIVETLRLVADCKDYEDYLLTFWKHVKTDLRLYPKDDLQKEWSEDIRMLRDAAEMLWSEDLSAVVLSEADPAAGKDAFFQRERSARKDAEILCALTLDACKRYKEAKERERVCDFAELEHIALDLLSDEEILQEIRDSVDCVFVDEYQDTNGLQEAILNRFAGEELFMVGDVKQSIYRFRFAEPRLFLDKRRLYQNGGEGENVDLNHNFRSEPEILNFVNMVMAEVMTPDFGGVDYRKDAMLAAGKETCGTAKIQVFLYEEQKKEVLTNGEIYSVREGILATESDPVEGEYVAETIRQLVGKADITDKEGVRKMRYSDIAVLSRNRNVNDIFTALEKYRIPYSAEGYDGLEGEERRVLWNLAKVLDNAVNDVPLASVMLSIWGFTEGELMRLAHKQGFAYGALYAPVEDALKEKVGKFREELNRFRMRAGFLGVDEILTEVMRETGYDAVLAKRGGSALARANAFLYRIQTNKYRRDLSAFLVNFPVDAKMNVAGETDAVRFMTVHGSKGLEFPVVFLVHAHDGFERRRVVRTPVIADSEWGVAMRCRDGSNEYPTAGYLAFADKQDREDRAEESRLAYVALTRAKSKLFISGKAPNKVIATPADGANCADWLQYVFERNAKIQPYFLKGGFEFDSGKSEWAQEIPTVNCTVSLHPAYPHEGGVKLGNKYAVSGLEKIDLDDSEKKQIFGFSGSQSAETGTAYHLIMEKLDFANRTEEEILRLKEEYRAVAGMENVDAKLLANALKNPLFDGAERYPLMKEAPFMMFCEGETVLGEPTDERTLVQGVVDLAILKPDGAVLVDYKVSGAPEAVLKERYAVQTKTYRRALEESGIAVKEVYLLILNRNLLIKMD